MPESMELEFVDREEQLERLRSMREGRRSARILLIKGMEGIGKSWVLRRMQRDHHDLPSALLDLSLPYGQDPFEFVRGLRATIGGPDWGAVDQVLDMAAQGGFPVDFQGYDQRALHELLSDLFSLDDLRTLCFNLQIDWDEIGGEGKSAKARELILYMNRRPQGMTTLVDAICRERPQVSTEALRTTTVGAAGFWGAEEGRAKELQLRLLADSLLNVLQTLTPTRPTILLLDTYEKSTKAVWDWFHKALLLSIRQGSLTGILVVIAGREIPAFDREWRTIVDATELSGLPTWAIRDYWVLRRAQPETALEFAMRYSGGIPLMLAQMADIGDLTSAESIQI